MLSEKTIREAFDTFSKGSVVVKEGSEVWIQMVAFASVLGWVLDDGKYVPGIEAILKEVRRCTAGSVSVSPGGS